ncbi:MAG: pirin family protein [Saprospiraceae bacterium]|nr:pirin family protein [Saprospiraceae bacterium]
MNYRSVSHILESSIIDMGSFQVKQPLPTQKVPQISPFLLLHHFGPIKVEPGFDPIDLGPHPHRGFEPVTFLYQGGIRHKDSLGNEGILEAGDIQWMTSGRGIIHSERASDFFMENGGTIEGIQLWVNLPAQNKMTQPKYQEIRKNDIPIITENKVTHRLVSGNWNGQKGIVDTFSPMIIIQTSILSGGKTYIPIPENFNACIYILSGKIILNDNFDYPAGKMIYFTNKGEGIGIEGLEDTEILVLCGEPIEEPLAQYGPFVMNSQTEIMEAMRDYQMGKMGFYID